MIALVTTSPSGGEEEARELAARFGLVFEPRRARRLPGLFAASAGAPLLLLGRQEADLYQLNQSGKISSARASLGLGLLRLARLLGPQDSPGGGDGPDGLLQAAKLQPGERVIDGTCGLGADALIAAHATGAPVLAIEKSPLLAALTQAALRRPPPVQPALREAALKAGAQIELRAGDHLDLLRAQPSRSASVVLFDTMFSAPVESQPAFSLVRALAEHAGLRAEALREATRVASRGVLVKDSPRGQLLRELGLAPIRARRFLWGWLDAAGK